MNFGGEGSLLFKSLPKTAINFYAKISKILSKQNRPSFTTEIVAKLLFELTDLPKTFGLCTHTRNVSLLH